MKFKTGDKIKAISNKHGNTGWYIPGHQFTVHEGELDGKRCQYINGNCGAKWWFEQPHEYDDFILVEQNNQPPKEIKTMLNSLTQDTKEFIQSHKQTIYMIAFLVIVDHLVFQGAFRQKLKSLMDSVIGKVQEKVEKA